MLKGGKEEMGEGGEDVLFSHLYNHVKGKATLPRPYHYKKEVVSFFCMYTCIMSKFP